MSWQLVWMSTTSIPQLKTSVGYLQLWRICVNYPDNELQAVYYHRRDNGKSLLSWDPVINHLMYPSHQPSCRTNRRLGVLMKPISDYAPAIEHEEYSSSTTIPIHRTTSQRTNTQIYNWDRQYYKYQHGLCSPTIRNVIMVRALKKLVWRRPVKFLSASESIIQKWYMQMPSQVIPATLAKQIRGQQRENGRCL